MKSKRQKFILDETNMLCLIDGQQYVVNGKAQELYESATKLMQEGNSKEAIALYQRSALLEHPAALTIMGQHYYSGKLVQQNLNLAVDCFKKAAVQKFPEAKHYLAICLFNGAGIEENKVEAMKLYISLPKEICSLKTLMRIAESYEEGTNGLKQSYPNALTYYELAASKGDVDASKSAMKLYLYGMGCKKDFDKAMTFSEPLKKFADEPELLNYIGSLYNNKSNFNKAHECYKLACEGGNLDATYSLARLYYENQALKNLPEAAKYFKLSADKGYSLAQYFWGFLLYEGKSVEQDFPEAIKYLTLAAEVGNSDADYMLGECHAFGKGVKVDWEKAFEFFKKAEDKQPKAQLALGYYYLDQKNIDLAFECFAKAAQHNNAVAATKQAYGLCLLHGIGCKPDLKKANRFLEKAESLAKNESPMEPAIIKRYLRLDVQELKLCAEKEIARKRYPFAFGHYKLALKKTENKKDLLLEIAAVQLELEDYDAALKSYESVLEITPNDAEVLCKKLVCLGQKNEDTEACLFLEEHSKNLLSFINESEEPWAERIYKLYLDRQSEKAEQLALEKQIKREKKLAKIERKKLAEIQEKLMANAPETEATVPENAVETVPEIAEVHEKQPEMIVEPVPQITASDPQQVQIQEKLAAMPLSIVKTVPQIAVSEPEQVQIQEELAAMPLNIVKTVPQNTVSEPKQVQILKKPAPLPATRVKTIPQIPVSKSQLPELENKAIIPAKSPYPKVKIPTPILEAALDVKKRTGAEFLEIFGSTALHLILETIYVEKINLQGPRNWNFFTTDPVEKLTLILGQFPPTTIPKIYVDNNDKIPYEKRIYLYCDENKNKLGVFSIHQLSIDLEGNIHGPELAFQDLKAMILRCIRPQAQIEKATLDIFLAKFSGTPFKLLEEQPCASPARQGIFAQTTFRSEVAFSENILMTTDKNQHKLSFSSFSYSKTDTAAVREKLGEVSQKVINNLDLNYSSKFKISSDGSRVRVELIFEFESLVDLETMQQFVNNMSSSKSNNFERP